MRRTADQITIEDARADRSARFTATVEPNQGRVVVPRSVRVRDGALEWSQQAPGWDGTWSPVQYREAGTSHWTYGRSDDAVLDRFIELYRQPDDSIVDFAGRYGVLYLRPDGVPNGEPEAVEYPGETYLAPMLARTPGGKGVHLATPRQRPVEWHRESLALWRDWSLVVRLLTLYGLTLRDTPGDIDPVALLHPWNVWDAVVGDDQPDDGRWAFSEPVRLVGDLEYQRVGPARDNAHRPATGEEQRATIGMWLDLLTGYAGPTMRLDWDGTAGLRPRVGRSRWECLPLGAPNAVFGDVMVQLVNTLLGDRRVRVCPDCGEPFEHVGRERACTECRLARRNETKRDYWTYNGHVHNARRRDDYNAKRRAEGRPT